MKLCFLELSPHNFYMGRNLILLLKTVVFLFDGTMVSKECGAELEKGQGVDHRVLPWSLVLEENWIWKTMYTYLISFFFFLKFIYF